MENIGALSILLAFCLAVFAVVVVARRESTAAGPFWS